MKNTLITIHNELQQIFTRGIDTIHMANALVQLEQIIQGLPDDKQMDDNEEE